ncbi:hypothetical protein AAVH_37438, partial [Aphelenchoides avenae]
MKAAAALLGRFDCVKTVRLSSVHLTLPFVKRLTALMPQMKTAELVEVRFDGDDFVGMVPSVNFQALFQQFPRLRQFTLTKLNCSLDWASLFAYINLQGIPSFHCVNTSVDFGTLPDDIEPPNDD